MSRRWSGIILLLVLLTVASVLALGVGSTGHGPRRILALIGGGGTPEELDALHLVRLPRLLVAIGCGAALAVAGSLLQAITRNPLADSGILGINAGAGLAMILLLASYPDRKAAPPALLPLAAGAGALATAMLVQALSWRRGASSPIRLLLVGVAIGASASALMLMVSLSLNPSLLRFVIAWQAGTLSGRDLGAAAIVLPVAIAGLGLAWLMARRLDVLALGDEAAIGLGVPVSAVQGQAVLLAAGLAATAVAFAGNLGFVGLVAPHLARLLAGPRLRLALPAAALAGAVLTVLADALARTVVAPVELPTGVVVALVGVPALLVLLIRWSRP